EMFQLGAELIGAREPEADVEVIRLALQTLEALSIQDFQINIGDLRFVQPLLREFDETQATEAREAIDRKDRAGLTALGARSRLASAGGRAQNEVQTLIGRSEVLYKAAGLAVSEEATEAIERLRAIDALLDEKERARIVYDLGEIRGLGYYTGIRF